MKYRLLIIFMISLFTFIGATESYGATISDKIGQCEALFDPVSPIPKSISANLDFQWLVVKLTEQIALEGTAIAAAHQHETLDYYYYRPNEEALLVDKARFLEVQRIFARKAGRRLTTSELMTATIRFQSHQSLKFSKENVKILKDLSPELYLAVLEFVLAYKTKWG